MHDGQAIETVAIPDGDRLTSACRRRRAARCSAPSARRARWDSRGTSRRTRSPDRCASSRCSSAAVVATNVVFMGMGEPLMNWKAVDVALTILNDPQRIRDWRAPHHGLDGRLASRHQGAGGAEGAVPAGDLGARADRRAARDAHAGEHEISAGGGHRRGGRVRPARDVRVRPARRRQRCAGESGRARRAGAALPGVRQPDPAASRRRDGIPCRRGRRTPRRSRGSCARRAWRSRYARAAGSTSRRRAASYG